MKHAAAGILASLVTTVVPGAARAAEDGAALYAAKCAACHGRRGEGARFAPRPIAGLPEAAVRAVLEQGKGKMRPPRGATPAELDAIARFVALGR